MSKPTMFQSRQDLSWVKPVLSFVEGQNAMLPVGLEQATPLSRANLSTTALVTLYSIITPLTPLKYHVFENIMENGAFAHFKSLLKFFLIFLMSKNRKCCRDLKIA